VSGYAVADHLVDRLAELGVDRIFGVPGDQMTATELATVLRERVPAVIVVVDNDGYTVERAIHGPDES
jgi:TPP-dependent 2-oxoacid decarboxylase